MTQSAKTNFIEEEFVTFLKRCGVKKDMVCRRIFHAFASPVGYGRKKRTLLAFSEACYCLCSFGIGDRQAQGECLFRIIDASGDGSVTRAELLQFMTSMLPDGFELPKIVTFKRVEQVFNHLDSDGGGELEADEFIDGVCGHEEVGH